MVWWTAKGDLFDFIINPFIYIRIFIVSGRVGLCRSKVKFGSSWTTIYPLLSPTSTAEIKAFSNACHFVSRMAIKQVTFFPQRNKG